MVKTVFELNFCQVSEAYAASMVLKCIWVKIELPKQINVKEMFIWSTEIKTNTLFRKPNSNHYLGSAFLCVEYATKFPKFKQNLLGM